MQRRELIAIVGGTVPAIGPFFRVGWDGNSGPGFRPPAGDDDAGADPRGEGTVWVDVALRAD